MRAHPVMIILGVLSAFAFGLLTGRIIPAVDTTAGGGSPDQVLIAPQAREGQEQAPRRAFQEIRNDDADRPEPVEVEGFAFSRLVIQTDTAEPKACIQFSEELDPDTNYRDFIRLTPNVRPALEVAGRSLCILGLSFNRDYTVEIRPGLRSADGEVLERGERVNVAFGDKPAYVGFAGEGVVLPRYEADGLAIETVNIDRVEVEVLRVSDRAIAQKRIVSGGAISEDSYYYAYGDESGDDIGAPVFKGELDVTSQQNETATTVFALGAALPNLKPGAYFVRVRDASKSADRRRPAQAWRWIVYTDMAITTYSGVDGVDVFVRSIETARPVAGVELALIARNNDILARVVTNTEGRARFDGPVTRGSGVLAPRMIMAFGPQDDFAVNDLQRAPLDLSDRNVAGRSTPAAIEGYLYFDRGIYRPGETAHITGLLRDTNTLVSVDRAVTAIVYRPNGAEAFRQRINSLNIGSFNFDFQAPRSAQRGLWRVSVEADGVGVVANETFSVEDFVPQRLEVALVADEKTPLDGASPLALEVRSRFLYGAPASDLPVEAEARLRVDPNPFPQFSGYRYGRASLTFRERFLTLPGAITDGDGAATVRLETGEAPKGLSVPLRVDVVVGVVEPGGRVVRESARIPVRPDEAYLGLRLSKPGGGFGQEEPAEIEAVLLDRAGEALARSIEWRLVEEDYWFDWYRQNGEWRWRRSFRDILVEDGKAETLAEGPVKISRRLDQGSYRLIATDPASGAQTEIRFYVGWRSYASSAEAPDQATVTGPTDPIAPGARARLVLDAPYEGEAIVTVATDKVQLVQRLKIEEGGREILIDTDPSWGSGFYVLANIVTPRDAVDRPVPRRAVGVAYVPFDMGERTLKIGMNAPDVIRPRTKIKLPLSIQGLRRDEPVLLTLAAVDEGILRLTKFVSPAPEKTYYGKRRLGVEIRDDYGRILNANLGAAARFGGDQIGGEGLTVVPTKSIALYSGPVEVDVDGLAEIDLDIPDFNGELRLMAVAWSQSALGSASSPLTVRDPVPALLSLPRFMAPGDKASATLSVDNVEGAEGEYTARLTAAGPVALSETVSFALAPGERKTRTFPFEATGEGIAQITVAVSGPNGESISRTTPIQVRTPFYPVTNRSVATLAPGERFVATDALLAGFTPGSGDVNVSFSRLRGVEPGALLASLYRYP
ncbi:MAG: MG2 domain-containing protein, partial [Pseudomonadota bacterium]